MLVGLYVVNMNLIYFHTPRGRVKYELQTKSQSAFNDERKIFLCFYRHS